MSRFDAQYYSRFYLNPRTRVITREEMARRARTLAELVSRLQIPVRRILDAGCGLGWMRAPLLGAFPRARYLGLEVSEHLCRRHGWKHSSLADYRARARFDLIVCHDVMQYLPERDARRAMRNLARLCRGALYFHAPTTEDWRDNADHSRSDGAVYLRPAQWYRKRLASRFRHAGFGLHVRRGAPHVQWELEKDAGVQFPTSTDQKSKSAHKSKRSQRR
ncbi:MAG TPA: class I SAM-dependent methyltransferase [Steroidobacter sp.]|nr:class I SAM-dependent methyltransferase [Steroidobacter sp.]